VQYGQEIITINLVTIKLACLLLHSRIVDTLSPNKASFIVTNTSFGATQMLLEFLASEYILYLADHGFTKPSKFLANNHIISFNYVITYPNE
jgi:hypothetical protein